MLLYHFPPIGGISMARNIRNVQYLPEHGWQPIVVTPGAADSNVEDPGSLALVPPDLTVERTGYLGAGDLQPAVRAARRMIEAVGTLRADRAAPISTRPPHPRPCPPHPRPRPPGRRRRDRPSPRRPASARSGA